MPMMLSIPHALTYIVAFPFLHLVTAICILFIGTQSSAIILQCNLLFQSRLRVGMESNRIHRIQLYIYSGRKQLFGVCLKSLDFWSIKFSTLSCSLPLSIFLKRKVNFFFPLITLTTSGYVRE